jgi:hypothetical protein
MTSVQLNDRCGISGDHDDRDIVIVQTWQKVFGDGLAPISAHPPSWLSRKPSTVMTRDRSRVPPAHLRPCKRSRNGPWKAPAAWATAAGRAKDSRR